MKIIKSSDVSNYLFCPVSWWNGITKGVKVTETMKAGEKHHTTIAQNQPKARIFHVSIVVAFIIIAILIIYRILG